MSRRGFRAQGLDMVISRRTTLAKFAGAGAALLLGQRAFAETVTYEYDALGRLTKVTYGDGTFIQYAYDAAGNRLQVAPTPQLPPFVKTIAVTGTGTIDLRWLADLAGYDGAQDADITYTVASGVTITGSPGGHGIDSGVWPAGYTKTLTLQISGAVIGGGGHGGEGAYGSNDAGAAGAGGDAIYCRLPMSIVINSGAAVRGGGGGGGGGGGWEGVDEGVLLNGGGGGGGYPNGMGGTGVSPASSGAPGSTSGGGAGGAGSPSQSGHAGGAGGTGGGVAAQGASGANGAGTPTGWIRGQRSVGGVAGYAIRKNGHTVSVTNNGGTINGTVG